MKSHTKNVPIVIICLLTACVVGALSSQVSAGITVTDNVSPIYDFTIPWEVNIEMWVGYIANNITDGNVVNTGSTIRTTNHVLVGKDIGSVGMIDVNGPGSLWNGASASSNMFIVGDKGEGWLNINNGAQVLMNAGFLGYDPNGSGFVNVDGIDSTLEHSEDLHIGHAGTGELIISNDGLVTHGLGFNTDAFIGFETGSDGRVTVSDANWFVSGRLNVGYSGDANMVITDGGHVSVGTSRIAYDSNAVGHVIVTGTASTWENSDTLYIGYGGDANLVVMDGGIITDVNSTIGYQSSAIGRATISGPNSIWTNAMYHTIGEEGQGFLTIKDGAQVIDDDATIAKETNSYGEVTVTGAGSLWSHMDELFVGHAGTALLTISDGATVTNDYGIIANYTSGIGQVTVTGPNSLWNNTRELYVGYEGEGSLSIADGGKVTALNALVGHNGQGHVHMGSNSTLEADQIIVNANGKVSGSGLLKADTVICKGTLEPGDGIGTLTINGNLNLGNDSVMKVEVDNSGHHDRVVVTGTGPGMGTADIQGGTVQLESTETITKEHVYTFLSAQHVQGSFDTLDMALLDISSVLEPSLTFNYGFENVAVKVTPVAFDDPNIIGHASDNQKAVGSAMQSIAKQGGNTTTNRLQNLPDIDAVTTAYGQLSGQSHTFLAPVSMAGLSKGIEAVSYRMHTVRSGLAYEPGQRPLLTQDFPEPDWDNLFSDDFYQNTELDSEFETDYDMGRDYRSNLPVVDLYNPFAALRDKEWGVWAKAFTVQGKRDVEDNSLNYDYAVYGTSFGVDWQVSDTWLFGITGGYSSGDVEQKASRNESQMSALHVGLYSANQRDRWYTDTVVSVAKIGFDTTRYIDHTSENLEGSFNGMQITAYAETGYNWIRQGGRLLQPLASLQLAHLGMDGYEETGGPSALKYDDQTQISAKGSVGLRLIQGLYHRLDGRNGVVKLRGRYVYELGDADSTVDTTFVSNPDTVFTVSDSEVSRDSILFGGSLDIRTDSNLRFSLDYDSQINSDDRTHMISFTFQYKN